MDQIINCTGALYYGSIVYYSHVVPTLLALMLAFFALSKSKFNLLSKIFATFALFFCLWLIGDVIVWVATDEYYDLISVVWASLDYMNIIFYILGAYFFIVLIKGRDVSFGKKILLFLPILPAWWLTYTNQSIIGFDVVNCQNFENDWLSHYKLAVEILAAIIVLVTGYIQYGKNDKSKDKQIVLVGTALLLFFAVFSVTEYISGTTGDYTFNLYGLFVLPIFLLMIMYSITDLEIFQFRIAGSQILVYTLMILTGSQFFFVKNSVNRVLTSFSFLISLGFGVLLIRNSKREHEQKLKIEALNQQLLVTNEKLKVLDAQKTEFISVASHQLRSPLTAIKGYASLVLEGDFGQISDAVRNAVETMFKSAQALVVIVGDYLDVSRIEQGRMRYDFSDFDLKALVETIVKEFEPNVKLSKLNFSIDIGKKDADYFVHADQGKIKQVISNLIDNSIKYTPSGSVKVFLDRHENDRIQLRIVDTGVGIPKDVIPKLFDKFSRAPGASQTNISGTGLGLYVAKKMMEAHRGRVWAESEGKDKGSTFFLELDALRKTRSTINDKLENTLEKFNSEIEPNS